MPLRHLLRTARRERGTALAIVCTIALGVAALTTAFDLADAALLRLPPFPDATRLVLVNSTHVTPRSPERRERWSYPRIQRLRHDASSFSSVASYTGTAITLTGTDEPEIVSGEIVSPEYFSTLSTGAERGRAFVAGDDGPGGQPVVVLGHALWQRRFASDPAVVGRSIRINGQALTVIGVMPAQFRGLSNKAELWLPTAMAPRLTYPEYLTTDQNFINVVARLKPGVDVRRANSEMRTLGTGIFNALPMLHPDPGQTSSAVVRTINDVRTEPATRRSVTVLFAAVLLLHLLACTNVASLLLGRAAARRREIAVRTALGATARRLLPVLTGDSAVLVSAGGALGLLLAFSGNVLAPVPSEIWTSRTLNTALASFSEPAFGLRSVVFAGVLTACTLLLVAWVPATALLRIDVAAGLRDGARGFTGGGATLRRVDARGVIVGIEAALAMMLLVAGGLMIDSFARMRRTDLGIDPSHLLTFELRVPDARVSPAAAPAFISGVLDAIGTVPGVVAASVDGGAPVSGSASSTLFVMGRPAPRIEEAPPVLRHYVGPEHFRTMGIPVVRGRVFTPRDVAGQPRVVIISQSAARRFWRNEDPLGQRVWFGGGSSFNSPDSSAEIVGIVGDVAYQPLDQHPFQPDFYTPYAQFTYAWRTAFVRTQGDPLVRAESIRRAILRVSPDTPPYKMQTAESLIGQSWARQRFDALLFGGFAMLALLLSASGIYAVVSYAVGQRTREMGIRLALGAPALSVVRLVVREGMLFPVLGLCIGLVASIATGRVIAASLYQLSPTDPAVLARTTVLLLVISVLACVAPALRATRVDPLVAMRAE